MAFASVPVPPEQALRATARIDVPSGSASPAEVVRGSARAASFFSTAGSCFFAARSVSSAMTRKVVSLPPVTVRSPSLLPERVLARLLRRIARPRVDDPAHPRERRADVLLGEVEARESVAERLEDVLELRARDPWLGPHVFLVVDVGGPDDRDPLPREREHRAPVARMEHSDRLRERQAAPRQDEVAPADLAKRASRRPPSRM